MQILQGDGEFSFHFKVKKVGDLHLSFYPADGGTSAATPVVAGVVAALRSKLPHNPADASTSPAAVRDIMTKTAEEAGAIGYDFEYGWGIVNGCEIARKLWAASKACFKFSIGLSPIPCGAASTGHARWMWHCVP